MLGGRPDGFRLGHGVLATRGLVAWMRTASSLSVSPPPASATHPPASEVVSLPGADQLVAVIAQMALAHAA